MDPLNTNQNPIASGSQMPPMPHEQHHKIGPVAGAIIIIILIAAGGLYFWGMHLNKEMEIETVPYIPSDTAAETNLEIRGELQSDDSAGLPAQSSSDDVSSIEADLNAMDMGQMESQNNAEMNNI